MNRVDKLRFLSSIFRVVSSLRCWNEAHFILHSADSVDNVDVDNIFSHLISVFSNYVQNFSSHLHVLDSRKEAVVVELCLCSFLCVSNLKSTKIFLRITMRKSQPIIIIFYNRTDSLWKIFGSIFLFMNIANFGLFLRVDRLPPSALRVRHL